MRRPSAPPLAAAAVLALLALEPVVAHAWDATGHETIARIAWDRLSPTARARALALLRAAPADAGVREMDDASRPRAERDRELFVRAATWADVVRDRANPERAKKYHRGPWHYRDGFWQQDTPGGPITDRPEIEPSPKGENAVAVLEASAAGLRDAARPDSLRAIDLLWVLHLVGDIHQPLHASARITPDDPGGDAGGNRFRFDSTGKSGNLHSFWDDALTRAHPRAAADSTLDGYIARVAAAVTTAYPASALAGTRSPVDFDRWTTASLETAKRELYPATLVRSQPPSAAYAERARAIAEPAVALAGYRLADVLTAALR